LLHVLETALQMVSFTTTDSDAIPFNTS